MAREGVSVRAQMTEADRGAKRGGWWGSRGYCGWMRIGDVSREAHLSI